MGQRKEIVTQRLVIAGSGDHLSGDWTFFAVQKRRGVKTATTPRGFTLNPENNGIGAHTAERCISATRFQRPVAFSKIKIPDIVVKKEASRSCLTGQRVLSHDLVLRQHENLGLMKLQGATTERFMETRPPILSPVRALGLSPSIEYNFLFRELVCNGEARPLRKQCCIETSRRWLNDFRCNLVPNQVDDAAAMTGLKCHSDLHPNDAQFLLSAIAFSSVCMI